LQVAIHPVNRIATGLGIARLEKRGSSEMTFVKRIGGAAALGAAVLMGCGLCARPVQAAFIVTLEQVGSNVVATGTGTIDLSGLSLGCNGCDGYSGYVIPNQGNQEQLIVGSGLIDGYAGATGPTNFGPGNGYTPANSNSGDVVGELVPGTIEVPHGYVSGDPLSDTSTYLGATFASLGVTPGTYVWTWGTAGDDSFTLQIGPSAVPEPSSLPLVALPLGFVMLLAARRRRSARTA
jgi:hypothetical protein